MRYGCLALAGAVALAAATTVMARDDDWKAHMDEVRAEVFVEADVDQSGTLSLAELATVPDLMKRRFAEKRFAEVDTNGDGAISQEEFLSAPPPHRRGGCRGPHPRDDG